MSAERASQPPWHACACVCTQMQQGEALVVAMAQQAAQQYNIIDPAVIAWLQVTSAGLHSKVESCNCQGYKIGRFCQGAHASRCIEHARIAGAPSDVRPCMPVLCSGRAAAGDGVRRVPPAGLHQHARILAAAHVQRAAAAAASGGAACAPSAAGSGQLPGGSPGFRSSAGSPGSRWWQALHGKQGPLDC